jgi:ElaB/YqjD/DUF883 family membrane-anchored ribosome-binding protein
MTATSQAFRQAADSPQAREAAKTAKAVGDEALGIAEDLSREASKQFNRARDVALEAYEEVHDASMRYPHITLAVALGLGFMLGAVIAGRR